MRTTLVLAAVVVLGACPKSPKRSERAADPAQPQPPKKKTSAAIDLAKVKVPIMKEKVKRVYSEEMLETVRPALAARPAKWPGPLRKETSGGYRPEDRHTVTLDLSKQVLRLDIPEDRSYGDREGKVESPLASSFYNLGTTGIGARFVPAAALAHKAKVIDDGLYAAVELAAESGAGTFPGRRELVARLTTALGTAPEPAQDAGAVVAASARLRGIDAKLTGRLETMAENERTEFLGDPKRSKPIGFYTWSEALARIFQGDRMLQSEVKGLYAESLAQVLAKDKQLTAAYEATLTLASRLTNPFARPDLRRLAAGEKAQRGMIYSFVPPSVSHETELIKKLYGDSPIPDGFNLADELIKRIVAGKLSLKPTDKSGWYDHQTYALEPLVIPDKTPEAKRLELSDSYRKELVGLFKALLALTRETHIKQLEVPASGAGMPELIIAPRLTAEPLATYYLRRARAYRFVRDVLERSFGKQALAKMFRLTPAGPVNISLDEELRLVTGLFHGAYLVTCDELGLKPEQDRTLKVAAHRQLFRAWAKTYTTDPDLQADIRAMVPLFYDRQRRKTKVWVVMGVTEKKLKVTFAKTPAVKALVDARGKAVEANRITWEEANARLAYFVTAERYVSKILDREQFRALCDEHKTASEILKHLE